LFEKLPLTQRSRENAEEFARTITATEINISCGAIVE